MSGNLCVRHRCTVVSNVMFGARAQYLAHCWQRDLVIACWLVEVFRVCMLRVSSFFRWRPTILNQPSPVIEWLWMQTLPSCYAYTENQKYLPLSKHGCADNSPDQSAWDKHRCLISHYFQRAYERDLHLASPVSSRSQQLLATDPSQESWICMHWLQSQAGTVSIW